jgi:hypothetical protein
MSLLRLSKRPHPAPSKSMKLNKKKLGLLRRQPVKNCLVFFQDFWRRKFSRNSFETDSASFLCGGSRPIVFHKSHFFKTSFCVEVGRA